MVLFNFCGWGCIFRAGHLAWQGAMMRGLKSFTSGSWRRPSQHAETAIGRPARNLADTIAGVMGVVRGGGCLPALCRKKTRREKGQP